MAISPQRVIRSTLHLVTGRVLGVGGSKGAIYDSVKDGGRLSVYFLKEKCDGFHERKHALQLESVTKCL